MCLIVLYHNLSPGPLWSTSWSGALYFVLHAFISVDNTHSFNDPFSGTTLVSRYQKGKNNLDFTETRDSEWQWHQLGHMQVCTSLQTDDHASTPPIRFLQAGCPSCRPTNSIKELKASVDKNTHTHPFVRDYLSEPVPERKNQSGFY